jgi:hypothetical protein
MIRSAGIVHDVYISLLSMAKCMGSLSASASSPPWPIRSPPQQQGGNTHTAFDHRAGLQPPIETILAPHFIGPSPLPRELLYYAHGKLKTITSVLKSRVRLLGPQLRSEGISNELFDRTMKGSFLDRLSPDMMPPQLALHICNHETCTLDQVRRFDSLHVCLNRP